MLHYIQNYLKGIKPVTIDGALWVLIAVFGTMQTFFTTDEAYKYVNPYVLFWLKACTGIGLASTTALRVFRDKLYSEHLEEKKARSSGDTVFITKPKET